MVSAVGFGAENEAATTENREKVDLPPSTARRTTDAGEHDSRNNQPPAITMLVPASMFR